MAEGRLFARGPRKNKTDHLLNRALLITAFRVATSGVRESKSRQRRSLAQDPTKKAARDPYYRFRRLISAKNRGPIISSRTHLSRPASRQHGTDRAQRRTRQRPNQSRTQTAHREKKTRKRHKPYEKQTKKKY